VHSIAARFVANRTATAGAACLTVIAVCILAGPALVPFDSEQVFWDAIGDGPSFLTRHFFGTDTHGRDLLSRTLEGGRVSLAVGVVAAAVSVIIGLIYGAVAGFVGGRVDGVMMRFVDVLYCLPFMFFAIILTLVFGRNLVLIFVAIGAVGWLTMARIVRAQAMSLRSEEFISAARVAGASRSRIIAAHIAPNLIGPVVVYAALTVPNMILVESFLSFLGLGVQEPQASWGTLVAEGAGVMETAPWILLFPGSVLTLTLLSLNAIADGIRDALDVRVS
jgi:oligopeptide transport system permease protein